MIGATSTSATPARALRPVTMRATDPARWRRNALAALTAEDRALLAEATGVQLTADGERADGRSLVPALATAVARDRLTGQLPAGHPITRAYLEQTWAALPLGPASAGTIQDITALLDVLARHGVQQPLACPA
ncbi:hypothetical protein [Modestobacter sp. VKM Ac-2985]|uniref:hypothetical protein n=1 Tax=Modestobacter sp. VKM Ac-2985 TaxID=3004139 RepID=UPI0022AB5CAC|nr:hypothetical protein [Modestobacter sp. VKM Ac-2985]MCZ2837759.1 hypothetical protein [Modestobacter sp. VKM Ac-2985]